MLSPAHLSPAHLLLFSQSHHHASHPLDLADKIILGMWIFVAVIVVARYLSLNHTYYKEQDRLEAERKKREAEFEAGRLIEVERYAAEQRKLEAERIAERQAIGKAVR